jgi:hypothetical protein
MKIFVAGLVLVVMLLCMGALRQSDEKSAHLSYKNDVYPIIDHYCLPCHDEDSYNPSELSLDTYDLMMSGGKHGQPVVPGKPDESLIIKKMTTSPPFGKQMPVIKKKGGSDETPPRPSEQEISTLSHWIEQGAKNN